MCGYCIVLYINTFLCILMSTIKTQHIRVLILLMHICTIEENLSSKKLPNMVLVFYVKQFHCLKLTRCVCEVNVDIEINQHKLYTIHV